ncbi:MAG: hypothetical protein ATN31_01625 [Candidatus Epulonipiscioides saccharophilum]|nr:MAG: hypothetical protein ATN31_01625 [Epulopiscium sp. AS2M-Bin001]
MKKGWFIITIILMQCPKLYATESITFMDKNLHQAILEQVDKNNNMAIEKSEVENITMLNLYDEDLTNCAPITSMYGLKSLEIANNNFSNLSICASMSNLATLNAGQNQIKDISQIKNLYKLEELHLNNNKLIDISPVLHTKNLRILYLDYNIITDIQIIDKLFNLEILNISNNKVQDISALRKMFKIKELNLSNNLITDISALEKLEKLTYLNLSGNPLNLRDEETLSILNNFIDKGVRVIFDKEIPKITTNPTVVENNSKLENYLVSKEPTTLPDLNFEYLNNIDSAEDLLNSVDYALASLEEQHQLDKYITELFTKYVERGIEILCFRKISQNTLTIDKKMIDYIDIDVENIIEEVSKKFNLANIPLSRPIEKTVQIITKGSYRANVILDKSLMDTNIDNLRIVTSELTVLISRENFPTDTNIVVSLSREMNEGQNYFDEVSYDNTTYVVNSQPEIPIIIGLDLADEDNKEYQCIIRDGINEGGTFNPSTNKIEALTIGNGRFIVEEIKPSFRDLYDLSDQMKEAILIVVSKGIMEGISSKEFDAAGIVSREDFNLVLDNLGYPGNDFGIEEVLLRSEIIASIMNILVKEQNYFLPNYPENYLNSYPDYQAIPKELYDLLGLAIQETMLPERIDGNFGPNELVSRGELAIILKLLFDRIAN